MLSSYDLTGFSNKLRSIRHSLGYSQQEVFEKTGVNTDTLRRLENGLSIPRFDTLEVLSLFYKENLIILLDTYKISSSLGYFYDLIDYYMVNEDFEALSKTIDQFDSYTENNPSNIIDQREVDQLRLFYRGLALSYHNNQVGQDESIKLLENALKITNPTFVLNAWSRYKFNFLELRILFAIASIEGENRNCTLSNEILLHILNYLDTSAHAKFYEKMLIVKSLCIISYNYHRLDQHLKALEYADQGIKFCINHSILAYLHLLLFRKGSAMVHLKQRGYDVFIKQAIELLKIQEKPLVAENYQNYLERYDQTFDLT